MIWGTFIFYCTYVWVSVGSGVMTEGIYHRMEFRNEEVISIPPDESFLKFNFSCPEIR